MKIIQRKRLSTQQQGRKMNEQLFLTHNTKEGGGWRVWGVRVRGCASLFTRNKFPWDVIACFKLVTGFNSFYFTLGPEVRVKRGCIFRGWHEWRGRREWRGRGSGFVKGPRENDRVAKRISSCPLVQRNFNPPRRARICMYARIEVCLLWQFRVVLSLGLAACSRDQNYIREFRDVSCGRVALLAMAKYFEVTWHPCLCSCFWTLGWLWMMLRNGKLKLSCIWYFDFVTCIFWRWEKGFWLSDI